MFAPSQFLEPLASLPQQPVSLFGTCAKKDPKEAGKLSLRAVQKTDPLEAAVRSQTVRETASTHSHNLGAFSLLHEEQVREEEQQRQLRQQQQQLRQFKEEQRNKLEQQNKIERQELEEQFKLEQ